MFLIWNCNAINTLIHMQLRRRIDTALYSMARLLTGQLNVAGDVQSFR